MQITQCHFIGENNWTSYYKVGYGRAYGAIIFYERISKVN